MRLAAVKKREILELLIESEEYLATYGVRDCFPYKYQYPLPEKAAARQLAEGIMYTRYCGSVHACPVCTPAVMARYREETIALMRDWKSQGGFFYLQTFTQRTNTDASTSNLYAGLSSTWSAMKKSSTFTKHHKRAGEPEYIKVLEESVSSKGWNIHFHVLWFFPKKSKVSYAEDFLDALKVQWSSDSTRRTALGAEAHAQHWKRVTDKTQNFAETMATYLFKHGYFNVRETQDDLLAKTSWEPFDLLKLLLYTGEVSFGDAWLDFQFACKGRNRVRFTRGLITLLWEIDTRS